MWISAATESLIEPIGLTLGVFCSPPLITIFNLTSFSAAMVLVKVLHMCSFFQTRTLPAPVEQHEVSEPARYA